DLRAGGDAASDRQVHRNRRDARPVQPRPVPAARLRQHDEPRLDPNREAAPRQLARPRCAARLGSDRSARSPPVVHRAGTRQMSVETYVSASTLPLRFVVTVDTEADDAWAHPDEIRLDNIRALPRFQELCERFSVVPTYLLTYECAHRDEALSILAPIAASARCEIGHHLHVWTCPPFAIGDRDVDRRFVLAHQFMLPDALFVQKAERLRQEIERSFGRSPTSHRAGRWGIDPRSVDWLCRAGFVAETSLRPSVRLPPALGHHASTRYTLHRNPSLWASTDGDTGPVELPVTVDLPQGA